MAQKAILNGSVYTPSGVLEPGVILLDGGKIKAISKGNEGSIPDGTVALDARPECCPRFCQCSHPRPRAAWA